MKTCGDCPRRPAAGSAPRGCSQERSRRSSPAEGTSSFAQARQHLTCCWTGAGLVRPEAGALTRPFSAAQREVSEGSNRRSRRRLTRPRRFSPTVRASAKRGSPIDPKPARAVKHGAAGGWMNRKVGPAPSSDERRKRPSLGHGLDVEHRRVYPTALGGWSPEVVFVAGARDAKRRL